MNQRSRQVAKNWVEKDFFKLMNNAYFGYDCCNNLNNFKFVPTFAELNEMSYIKEDYNIFDNDVSKFVSSELLERKIDKKFNDKMMKIQKNDPF